MSKQEALTDIIGLARAHGISAGEIADALREPRPDMQKSIVAKLFSYIGGILVFSGIAVFIGMFWGAFPPAFRVMITLGTGICAFVAGIAASRRPHLAAAVAPLFLIAAVFESGGLAVLLDEYGGGGKWEHAALFISGTVGAQFAVTFIQLRHSVLAFFALAFGGIFAATAMHMLGIDDTLAGMAIGASYVLLATALAEKLTYRQAGFWHGLGGVLLLACFYEQVENTVFEVAFPGLAALMLYLSIVVKSRSLLGISTLALICYIGDFAYDVFADNGLFPLGLIAAGGVFLGLGAGAMKIDRQYLRG